MSGLLERHLENIMFDIKANNRKAVFSWFPLTICALASLLFVVFLIGESCSSHPDISILNFIIATIAIFISMFTVLSTNILSAYKSRDELFRRLTEHEIRLKEDRLKNIGESINLFYLPLSVLLTIPDKPENTQTITQKIAEINCNKHLAEPRVRAVFEFYMEGKKDQKLLELAYRDIENLQKEYAMVKQLLVEEADRLYENKKT